MENAPAIKWVTIKIPEAQIKDVDTFLSTPLAQKNGIVSRGAFYTYLGARFLEKVKDDYADFARAAEGSPNSRERNES